MGTIDFLSLGIGCAAFAIVPCAIYQIYIEQYFVREHALNCRPTAPFFVSLVTLYFHVPPSQRTINDLQYALPRFICGASTLHMTANVMNVAYFLRGNDTCLTDSLTYALGTGSDFVWDAHAWFGFAAILYIVFVTTRSALLTLTEGADASENSTDLARAVLLGIWVLEVLTSIAVNALRISLNRSWVQGFLCIVTAFIFTAALGVAWTALFQLRAYLAERTVGGSGQSLAQPVQLEGFVTFIRILTVMCLFLIGWNLWLVYVAFADVASSPPILPRTRDSNSGIVSYVSLALCLYGIFYTWKFVPDGDSPLDERSGVDFSVRSARSSFTRGASSARVAPLGVVTASQKLAVALKRASDLENSKIDEDEAEDIPSNSWATVTPTSNTECVATKTLVAITPGTLQLG